MWKKIYAQEWFTWLVLIGILFIPTLPLFHPGLPITHDGKDHVARIANFYLSLSEGNLIPRWAENLNWGYGHPILMFLYPLPSYMASLFHFLGFSFTDSTKLVFGVSYILSGLSMYLWLRAFLNKKAAFVGSLLYAFAPYRFVDLYVRGAIGEHIAFIFPPLVFYFLYQIKEKQTLLNMIGGGVSLAALILAHNAISIMFIPFIFLYGIYLWFKASWNKQFLVLFGSMVILGFCLSAFFWLPATLEGKYTLRSIVLKGQYDSQERFLPLRNFIYSTWSYGISGQFSVQLGVIQWIVTLASIALLFARKKLTRENRIWILFFVIALITSIWFMTPSARFIWSAIPLIQQFQFPWRFLSVSIFLSSMLGALFIYHLPEKWQKYAFVGLLVGTLGTTFPYWHAKAYLNQPDSYYSNIYYGTTDTGESAPIWSVRFMESTPDARMDVIGGKASIKNISRTSTRHVYKVNAQTPAQLRENTLYFPGWEVLVDNQKQSIEYQDPHNRGVITFIIPEGEHAVQIFFKDTKLRTLANALSVCALVIVGILAILSKRIWLRFQ
jgi:hypothetical protein